MAGAAGSGGGRGRQRGGQVNGGTAMSGAALHEAPNASPPLHIDLRHGFYWSLNPLASLFVPGHWRQGRTSPVSNAKTKADRLYGRCQ